MTGQRELVYQSKIIASCEAWGGRGHKWATTRLVGAPDLILTLPEVGVFLVEVKHIPEFGTTKMRIPNPLGKVQDKFLRDIQNGGGLAFGLIIAGGASNVMHSFAHPFQPGWPHASCHTDDVYCSPAFGYIKTIPGYNMPAIVKEAIHAQHRTNA